MKFGILDEWFLRIPSVLFGILTVWLVFKLADEFFGKKAALLSSFFLAISQFHIYYSQELRMYSLLCLLSVLSIWTFHKKNWVIHSIANSLGFYTNYMFPFILIPQIIWIYKDRAEMKKWFLSVIFTVISFTPWIPIFIKQLEAGRNINIFLPEWKDLSSLPFWKLIPQIFIKFSFGRISFDDKYFYSLLFLVLLCIYGYIFLHLKKKINRKILFMLNWFLAPFLGTVLVSLIIPIANVWRLIFLLPPFLIIVSYLVTSIKYSKIIISLLVISFLIADVLYWLYPKYQREKWREAVSFLEERNVPITFTAEGGFAPYIWYKMKRTSICGPQTVETCLEKGKVFYVSYLKDLFDKNNVIEEKMAEKKWRLVEVKNFEGVGFIYYYENYN